MLGHAQPEKFVFIVFPSHHTGRRIQNEDSSAHFLESLQECFHTQLLWVVLHMKNE